MNCFHFINMWNTHTHAQTHNLKADYWFLTIRNNHKDSDHRIKGVLGEWEYSKFILSVWLESNEIFLCFRLATLTKIHLITVNSSPVILTIKCWCDLMKVLTFFTFCEVTRQPKEDSSPVSEPSKITLCLLKLSAQARIWYL